MPKIKTQVIKPANANFPLLRPKPKVQPANDRLRLINAILVKFKHINNREELLKKVNKDLEEDISPSTLDKDISALRHLVLLRSFSGETEVELKYTREGGYRYSEEGYSYFSNSLNEEDKNLLILASSLFNALKGTPLQEKFIKLVNKVLSETITGGPVHDLATSVLVQMEATNSHNATKWIPQLLEAINEKKTLEIQYKSFGKEVYTKNICPYVLKQYHGRWYMVAYDHNCNREDKTNVFALDSIKQLEQSGYKYFVDNDFNLVDYFRYSLGVYHMHKQKPVTVVLEFTKQIEFVQTYPLHISQKTVLSKKGEVLTVTIEVYPTPELEMMIQSFGSAVRVKMPESLATKIADSAKQVVQLYKT